MNIIYGDCSSRVDQHPIVARTVVVTYKCSHLVVVIYVCSEANVRIISPFFFAMSIVKMPNDKHDWIVL